MTDKTQDRLERLMEKAKVISKNTMHGDAEDIIRDLLATLEQQQAAIQLAEEALTAYAKKEAWLDFVQDSYSGLCWQFDWDGNKGGDPWDIAQAALTAIKNLKEER